MNPAFANALNASDSFCFLYVVEDTSLLMSSINVIGVVLSPITFPCESLTHCNSFGPDL